MVDGDLENKIRLLERWRDYSWQAMLLSIAEKDNMHDVAFGNVAYILDLVVTLLNNNKIDKPVPLEVPEYSKYKYGEYPEYRYGEYVAAIYTELRRQGRP